MCTCFEIQLLLYILFVYFSHLSKTSVNKLPRKMYAPMSYFYSILKKMCVNLASKCGYVPSYILVFIFVMNQYCGLSNKKETKDTSINRL